MIRYFAILLCFIQCGDNAFQELEEEDRTAIEAIRLMELEQPERAVSLILRKLGSGFKKIFEDITYESNLINVGQQFKDQLKFVRRVHKGDDVNNLVSIISSAKAQMHGIDPFSVALSMATDEGDGNAMTALFPIIPDANLDNIFGINVATTVLNSLGVKNFSSADNFKLAIFITVNVSLTLKALDTDADGKISLSETSKIDDDFANVVLGQLTAAGSAVTSSQGEEESEASKAVRKIASIKDVIDKEAGDSNAERLKNYLLREVNSSKTTIVVTKLHSGK